MARNRRLGIPDWSQWIEGSTADPFCIVCKGIGYIREENLDVSDPRFGKVSDCDCKNGIKRRSRDDTGGNNCEDD